MLTSSEQQKFEIAYSKKIAKANFNFSDDIYECPLVMSSWVGWNLKEIDVQTQAANRRLSAPREASPAESIFEAVRHVLKLIDPATGQDFKGGHGVSISHTQAWTRLYDAFLAIHPDLDKSFPQLIDFQYMGLDSKRAFDYVFSPASQKLISTEENARLLAIFEHGLIFASTAPDLRTFTVPLSENGDSVFIDGLGMVPIDYSNAEMGKHNPKAKTIVFGYTNYRGEYGVRTVIPVKIIQGSTEFHSDEQWLLEAFDIEKQAMRSFAINDITKFMKSQESEHTI